MVVEVVSSWSVVVEDFDEVEVEVEEVVGAVVAQVVALPKPSTVEVILGCCG
jgi:hypothetical protein